MSAYADFDEWLRFEPEVEAHLEAMRQERREAPKWPEVDCKGAAWAWRTPERRKTGRYSPALES